MAPTIFHLGALYEARGDTVKVVKDYGEFAEPWKSADAKLQPRVPEGRSRIARLSLR